MSTRTPIPSSPSSRPSFPPPPSKISKIDLDNLNQDIEAAEAEGVEIGKAEENVCGEIEGFDAGYQEGYRVGQDCGLEEGYEDGLKQGREEGKDDGIDIGRREGRNVVLGEYLGVFRSFIIEHLEKKDIRIAAALASVLGMLSGKFDKQGLDQYGKAEIDAQILEMDMLKGLCGLLNEHQNDWHPQANAMVPSDQIREIGDIDVPECVKAAKTHDLMEPFEMCTEKSCERVVKLLKKRDGKGSLRGEKAVEAVKLVMGVLSNTVEGQGVVED